MAPSMLRGKEHHLIGVPLPAKRVVAGAVGEGDHDDERDEGERRQQRAGADPQRPPRRGRAFLRRRLQPHLRHRVRLRHRRAAWEAATTRSMGREGRFAALSHGLRRFCCLISAKAGISCLAACAERREIPAFAGMTEVGVSRSPRSRGRHFRTCRGSRPLPRRYARRRASSAAGSCRRAWPGGGRG